MHRVTITGSTGAGKSTLAAEVARRLGAPHVELDALYWDPGWTAVPWERVRARADVALPVDGRWVADGNYSRVRDISWGRADTLVWLDYSLPLVFWQLARRTVRRGLTHAELFNGNRETLWKHLFTRESLFLWLLRSYRRHWRENAEALAQPEYAHLTVKRFRWPSETRRWLAGLGE